MPDLRGPVERRFSFGNRSAHFYFDLRIRMTFRGIASIQLVTSEKGMK
jgi:hypothetical protein